MCAQTASIAAKGRVSESKLASIVGETRLETSCAPVNISRFTRFKKQLQDGATHEWSISQAAERSFE